MQAIAGEFAYHLLVEFNGAGVAGAVIQPLQAIALRQRQRLQVSQRIPLVLQLAVHALFAEQPPGGVIAHLHAVRLDAQRRTARRWQAVQLAQPPHGVEAVMPFRAGVAAPDQLPRLVEAEALFALRQLTRAAAGRPRGAPPTARPRRSDNSGECRPGALRPARGPPHRS